MKLSERALLSAMYTAHLMAQSHPDPYRRNLKAWEVVRGMGALRQNFYYLEKWTSKGWWNYGVAPDCGWFEEEGLAVCRQLFGEPQ